MHAFSKDRLTLLLAALALCCLVVVAACQNKADRFVGTFSNAWAGKGANFALVVSKDGDNFIVKLAIASTGRVIETYSAKVDGPNLVLPQSQIFPRLSISPDGNALSILDGDGATPEFRRVQ